MRKTRATLQAWQRWVAGGCAGVIVLLGILAVCPEAHHWFHHDCDHEDHECVVTSFSHGSTPAQAVVLVLLAAPLARPLPTAYVQPDVSSPAFARPLSQGPPAA